MTSALRPFLVLTLATVALLAVRGAGPSRAQTGTPAAGGYAMPPGVTYDGLAFGDVPMPWTGGAGVGLFRARLEPGATVDLEPEPDPYSYLVYVESGTITFRVDAPAEISRATAGTPAAQATEPVTPEHAAALTDVALRQGDAGLFSETPNGAPGQARNDGQEPAVALVVMLAPPTASSSPSGTPAS
jgi:hypothetical protein